MPIWQADGSKRRKKPTEDSDQKVEEAKVKKQKQQKAKKATQICLLDGVLDTSRANLNSPVHEAIDKAGDKCKDANSLETQWQSVF